MCKLSPKTTSENWDASANSLKSTLLLVSVMFVFSRYKEHLDRKTQLEEEEREIKLERQKMEAEAQRTLERERELERLRDDNER